MFAKRTVLSISFERILINITIDVGSGIKLWPWMHV